MSSPAKPASCSSRAAPGHAQLHACREPFYRSTNGGAAWTAIPNVEEVLCLRLRRGRAGTEQSRALHRGLGQQCLWRLAVDNNAQSWTNIGTYPLGELDQINTISGDPNHYGEVYVGFAGGGYAYLPAASGTSPSVTGANASPSTGTEIVGDTITFAVDERGGDGRRRKADTHP